ncbi:MAG: hypothetical protein OXI67_21715 [Candidatus Poribacteria bacterium]|nr:hypothetical protein [Candidatus Poribacteria bacterium]
MTRDITPIKWIIGAIALLIIIAGACYFWYQHSLADERKAAADAQQLLRQSETERQAKAKSSTAKQAGEKVPAESETPTAEKQKSDETVLTDETESTQAQTETDAPTAETQEVRVSPFGFGPYPEIPDDYIIPPDKFKWEYFGKTVDGELMSRVRIKLWNQGIQSEGATFNNGKVYPIILGTVYIEWAENGKFIRGMMGHPDDDKDAIASALEAGQPPPEGITVLNRNEAGIDPYSFLELNKKE